MNSSLVPLNWYTCNDSLIVLETLYQVIEFDLDDDIISTWDLELLNLMYARACESTNAKLFRRIERQYTLNLGEWFGDIEIHRLLKKIYQWILYLVREQEPLDMSQADILFNDWENTIIKRMEVLSNSI